jgi:DNA primase
MGLFPQHFIDDLRLHADIVQVVQQYVPLRQSGATFKGLCPFHAEKSPSFHVNREKGFFHCFGCNTGGDVFKFIELQEKLSFPDAVRHLAERLGVPVPEDDAARRDAAAQGEREALLKVHEIAAGYFAEALGAPGGAPAREVLADRGVRPSTIADLAIGYAPAASRDALTSRLLQHGFPRELVLRSGLAVDRDGQLVDRFRGRIMFPICRDTGAVIAFGGRAMEADQQPKYLNSPETAIYSKARVLYGLNVSRAAIRRVGYAVIVEGYFDFAQPYQEGGLPVVASCGTALTTAQARLLRRYAEKVVLSYDPDAAGRGAAVRSCELLVTEGFQVNVAVLPAGEDPDTFVRRHGGAAYRETLQRSRPYLEYLLDRAAREHDLRHPDGRRAFVTRMLNVAASIPDAVARDQFGDRVAHKAGVTEEVLRAEIRKAAAARRTGLAPAALAPPGAVKPAEKGLLWALHHAPDQALTALRMAEDADLEGLAAEAILRLARGLAGLPPLDVPSTLRERLNKTEAEFLTAVAAAGAAPAPPDECVRALKRDRYQRQRAELQREIDRLQTLGESYTDEIERLWQRKLTVLREIEALTGGDGA